ncbi:UL8 protein [Gallid alphaherpesvirus 3]|uniref:UL8 protein n=2 Tax=Gallid alphaherpesvirus 3 TaxID=35250 RepID=Q782T8_9ALPH|nr:helicase-primase subunit [Gallid alphaherpesvirus 3]YP_010795600.1 UL8-like protein [Gallid alphaherpesvirus 3]BAA82902.1 UL8 product homolog [Marek's disease virus serotype 2 MDV2]AEI00209.1 UL8-like protein [Gallid alphaherpesvirus 3]QEY02228.1 UL8-like protein [Gallid alphaherpesvirus 3]BAB16516.1 UL8 protein [Gallid alphaherpesvirus 3]
MSTMAEANTVAVQKIRGCICYTTLYRVWTSRDRTDGLTALCYLLFRNECGTYSAHYSTVNVSGRSIARAWGLNPDSVTDAALAIMASAGSVTGVWPSCRPDQHALWKALLAVTLAKLRIKLGYHAYFAPVDMYVDTTTGLVISCEPLPGDRCAPRPGLLKTDGAVHVEESRLVSTAMEYTEGAHLAHIKLSALKHDDTIPEFDSRIEIYTKEDRFIREYKTVGRRSKKIKWGNTNRIFTIVERVLSLPDSQAPIKTAAPVPTSFDCLVTTPAEFSLTALLAIYAQWHKKIYSLADDSEKRLAPIFVYIGPETSPRGEDVDYACTIGFPLWPLLKTSTAAPSAIRKAVGSYSETDGLWPLAGPRTFHLLAPWHPETHPTPGIDVLENLKGRTSSTRRQVADDWTAGRITCIFREPTFIEQAYIAKFDFSAFFATLYLGLFPDHSRLRAAVKARLQREKNWLKQPIIEFGGLLKRVREDVYRAIICIGNHISLEVEATASALGFAPCTYVKDGLWGTFTDGANNVLHSSKGTETALETLRVACGKSANKLATSVGLRFPEDIRLEFRMEGVYTHAVSWNANCYWLWNETKRETDFVGFPARPAFAGQVKKALSALLEEISACNDSDESLRTIQERSRAVFEELVTAAFEARGDACFWSCPAESRDHTHYITALGLRAAARFDTSAFSNDAVHTVTVDGSIAPLTCSLFEGGQVILPAIACIDHMKPIMSIFSRLLIGALTSKWPNVDLSKFTFDVEPYRFLFVRNK